LAIQKAKRFASQEKSAFFKSAFADFFIMSKKRRESDMDLTLALAQMALSADMDANQRKILEFIKKGQNADLMLFCELMYSPFFCQYEKRDASKYLMEKTDPKIKELCAAAKEYGMYLSANVYLKEADGNYDASLWISPKGKIEEISTMMHIKQAKYFYEQDYYTPGKSGFKVLDTPFGKIGIVICFDRHIPQSIQTCASLGADLVLISTANISEEDLEMFEWEMRVAAMHNSVFIAMCNRVGKEDALLFAGQSLIIDPAGALLYKAGEKEELIEIRLDLSMAKVLRDQKEYLALRRKAFYL
jgi:predicted amidohydrolase